MKRITQESLIEVLEAYDGDINSTSLALKVTKIEVEAFILHFGIDLVPLNNRLKHKLNLNKSLKISDANYNLVLAYFYKQLPGILTENDTKNIFDQIKLEAFDLIEFIKKADTNKIITNIEFLINQRKISIYSKLIDTYCKKELRCETLSSDWDLQINSFCRRLGPEILKFNKNFAVKYSDLTESYVFYSSNHEYPIRSKSLLHVLSDILSIPIDQNLFLYYLAIKNTPESEKLREIWAFDKVMNMVKTEKMLKKT